MSTDKKWHVLIVWDDLSKTSGEPGKRGEFVETFYGPDESSARNAAWALCRSMGKLTPEKIYSPNTIEEAHE